MKLVLSIDPVKYPLTGIGRYTYELARHLGLHPDIEQLRFLRGARLVDDLPGDLSSDKAMRGVRQRLLKSRVAVRLYQWAMSRLKTRALRHYEDAVFHGPNFYLPPFRGRSVVTMHDLSPYLWADSHPAERVRYMRSEIELSMRRASVLITDSEYSRKEIAEYFSWPLDRIRAVPLASSDDFFPRSPADLQAAMQKHALSAGNYSLFLGTIEPRKNIEGLLTAYEQLPEHLRKRWPLMIAGYSGWRSEAIHARMRKVEAQGWARYLGYLPADELPLLMAGARLFVFPSLYEGFGLPVLEAMASGVPVVCSDSSSLPEVAGDAAMMCAAEDVDRLNELIARGLEDEAWRIAARNAGLEQAARFNWSRCADETVEAYRLARAL